MSVLAMKKLLIALSSISAIFVICYIYRGNRHIYNLKLIHQLGNSVSNVSACSDDATGYGPGQRVISYTFYVNEETDIPRYLAGIKPNLQSISDLYPGWVVRIYTDEVNRIRNASSDLFTDYKFLFWCDVTKIPFFGDIRDMIAMTWRFLPLGDPMVDIFISRDLDSPVTIRGRKAVEEWERSNYSFHTMRDNPSHRNAYLGGLWGAKNVLLGPERSRQLQSQLIEESAKVGGKSKDDDQDLLKDLYYSKLSTETMAHDSYFCKYFPDKFSVGFPTRRESPEDFVGNVMTDPELVNYGARECPEECRREKDWTTC